MQFFENSGCGAVLIPLFFHNNPVFGGSKIGLDIFFLYKSLLSIEIECRLITG
jgi:hypothetical protein